MHTTDIYAIVKKDILNNSFGKPGEYFLSLQALAKKYGIGNTSAQKVITKLREEELIELIGKRNYLTHGFAALDSPYMTQRKKSRVIGVMVPNMHSVLYGKIFDKLSIFMQKHGYKTIAVNCDRTEESEKEALSFLKKIGVDGVFAVPELKVGGGEKYVRYVLPLIVMGNFDLPLEQIAYVCEDSVENIVRKLWDKGYHQFTYVYHPRKNHATFGMREYIEKSLSELSENDLRVVNENAIRSMVRTLSKTEGKHAILFNHEMILEKFLEILNESKFILDHDTELVVQVHDKMIKRCFAKDLTFIVNNTTRMAEIIGTRLIKQIEEGVFEPKIHEVEMMIVWRE